MVQKDTEIEFGTEVWISHPQYPQIIDAKAVILNPVITGQPESSFVIAVLPDPANPKKEILGSGIGTLEDKNMHSATGKKRSERAIRDALSTSPLIKPQEVNTLIAEGKAAGSRTLRKSS